MNTKAGMVRRFSRCTPMLRPIRKVMSTIQRLAWGSSACSYHLHMAQKTRAVKKEDMAYTSPSTALNQKVSEKQYASAPTAPEAKIAIACPGPTGDPTTTLLAKNTMVKYSRKMVRALRMAFMAFTATAACCASTGMVKKRAKSWNTGFPGGWPTSSLYDDAMNSPQSQKDAVGSMVER